MAHVLQRFREEQMGMSTPARLDRGAQQLRESAARAKERRRVRDMRIQC